MTGGVTRTVLEFWAARGLLGTFGTMPRSISLTCAEGFASLACTVLAPLRHTAERNLRVAFPELSDGERRKLARRSIRFAGRQLAEFSRLARITPRGLRELIELDPAGLEELRSARERGRGILFVTAHLGSWELLVFGYSALFEPISYMLRPLRNARVDALVRSVRGRFGNRALDKKLAGLTAMRLLKAGGTLGVLADLNALPREGVFTPFFGHLACSTAGVAALARATDATVLPVFAPWDAGRGRYIFRGGPAIEMVRTEDGAHDLEVNTAKVVAVLETAIREHPEQWLWVHDRWRARPRPGDRVCTC